VSATADVARMLTLVPWLLERPGASVTEIAETFAVDPATIRADLGHLDFCGLPGLGGGDLFEVTTVSDRVVVHMAEELKRPLRPTAGEALRLVLTVDAVAEVLGDELPALRSAIGKVRAAVGLPEQAADVLGTEGPTTLAALRDAIISHRQLLLSYQGRTDEVPTTRRVDPWALHVVDGTWYLQGHDHGAGDRRIFRLDRVVDVEISSEVATTTRPAILDPPRYVPGPEDATVVLDVAARGRWLEEALSVDEVEIRAAGGARLTLRTDALPWLARLVLMAGGDVTVVAPDALRERVRSLALQARQRYAQS
jgi:proteasome accessory factor C